LRDVGQVDADWVRCSKIRTVPELSHVGQVDSRQSLRSVLPQVADLDAQTKTSALVGGKEVDAHPPRPQQSCRPDGAKLSR
jgi:hypothetical protein